MRQDTEDSWLWAQAIELLSLDLSSAFTTELGASDFYSSTLKDIARSTIPDFEENETFDEWFIRLSQRVDVFVNSVVAELGEETLYKIGMWIQEALSPSSMGDTQRTRALLRSLVDQWERDDQWVELPLGGHGESHIRGIIRDYAMERDDSGHIGDILGDIEEMSRKLDSEWDGMMDTRYGIPEWSMTAVWTVCDDLHSRAFWERACGLLSREQAAMLLRWLDAQARKDGLDYIWTPPRTLVQCVGACT